MITFMLLRLRNYLRLRLGSSSPNCTILYKDLHTSVQYFVLFNIIGQSQIVNSEGFTEIYNLEMIVVLTSQSTHKANTPPLQLSLCRRCDLPHQLSPSRCLRYGLRPLKLRCYPSITRSFLSPSVCMRSS